MCLWRTISHKMLLLHRISLAAHSHPWYLLLPTLPQVEFAAYPSSRCFCIALFDVPSSAFVVHSTSGYLLQLALTLGAFAAHFPSKWFCSKQSLKVLLLLTLPQGDFAAPSPSKCFCCSLPLKVHLPLILPQGDFAQQSALCFILRSLFLKVLLQLTLP